MCRSLSPTFSIYLWLLPSLSPLLALCICNFWLTKNKQFLFVNLPTKKKNFFQVAFGSVLYYFAAAPAAVVYVLFFSKTFIRKTKRTKTNKQAEKTCNSQLLCKHILNVLPELRFLLIPLHLPLCRSFVVPKNCQKTKNQKTKIKTETKC